MNEVMTERVLLARKDQSLRPCALGSGDLGCGSPPSGPLMDGDSLLGKGSCAAFPLVGGEACSGHLL